ncbi:tyrosine-protein phosphatase non-receptor type substrate 1-like isoform 2-T2 [Clarias gariepinus]|uniref:tyrosine-protein phosphatase non-receptor type substrate 1-like isoform X2 n=1 Tax=Clarias gariepinus TaxID=13013 RepID=UPI00234CFC0F|nr:tyrosine-protein phosphatase non-receptor type substrate 1-like isoform X2 [Clarias gariepinus]
MPNMPSVKRLCLLLTFSFCSSTNTSTEDVTVFSGDAAFLPCPLQFSYSEKVSVKWLKDENNGNNSNVCEGNIQSNTISDPPNCKPRFKLNREPLGLNITGIVSSDAGVYNCVVTRLIPPPAEEISLPLRLKVFSSAAVLPSPTLQLISNTNSSCVELICSLEGLSPQQVNFTWTRATQLIHHLGTSSMNSTLTLCKPNWTEGETLTCQASYSHNRTLSKNITLKQHSASPSVSVACIRGSDGAPTMLCAAEGFYPADLKQSWLTDGEYISYLNTSLTPTYDENLTSFHASRNYSKNRDGSYDVTSYLHPSRTITVYYCWVNHSGLSKPILVNISSAQCTERKEAFTGLFVRYMVVGILFGLLVVTALFIEVYYQHLTTSARHLWSTADANATSEPVSNHQVYQHELKQTYPL